MIPLSFVKTTESYKVCRGIVRCLPIGSRSGYRFTGTDRNAWPYLPHRNRLSGLCIAAALAGLCTSTHILSPNVRPKRFSQCFLLRRSYRLEVYWGFDVASHDAAISNGARPCYTYIRDESGLFDTSLVHLKPSLVHLNTGQEQLMAIC